MRLLEVIKEVTLCKKRLQDREKELYTTDPESLNYDILRMEIELLRMLIDNLHGLINKQMDVKISPRTRKAVYSIKATIN